jgi:DNA-binding response OmpR family regulator
VPKRILVVDDDPSVREMVADYLEDNDYEVVTSSDGEEMARVLDSAGADLVILDVKMPGEDGFALARALRNRSDLPIIMLTAQDHEVDRILGLELGADDYLTKPFSPRELLARIRAVMRRHELAAAAVQAKAGAGGGTMRGRRARSVSRTGSSTRERGAWSRRSRARSSSPTASTRSSSRSCARRARSFHATSCWRGGGCTRTSTIARSTCRS